MDNISNPLIGWYSYNKRALPWRETKDPYKIWVSEIILQQTRVKQGLDYYYRFIDKYPDVQSLANSSIDELLKIWQGLGYYSRARNMHYTANEIVDKFKGEFPSSYDDLLKLKGIGDYTASAIASIAFNQTTAVLDGNVFRVISRFFGISESTQTVSGKKVFKQKLEKLIPKKDPGIFNQAIMEFGALQCTPHNPDCINCPLKTSCFAFNHQMIAELPVKKQKVKQKDRFFNYLLILTDEYTFIEQRTSNDIWKLLYQLPLIETTQKVSINELQENKLWINIFNHCELEIDPSPVEKKHILSHQKIHARFYKIKIKNLNGTLVKKYQKIHLNELQNIGVPKLIENYIAQINNLK